MLEIDALAEAAIVSYGFTVSDVASRLLTGTGNVHLTGSNSFEDGDSRLAATLWGGRLVVTGYVSPRNPSVFLIGTELRIDDTMSDEDGAALVGKRGSDLFAHPALIEKSRVTSVRKRDQGCTDVRLRVRRRFITNDELQTA